ncbi:2-haloalkanoic acid dehalogenase type II [Streptomyces sp. 3212.3]|nr:2-haloalkanoic acid dehalogenase type II [Streptomyces sp. 3212.3]
MVARLARSARLLWRPEPSGPRLNESPVMPERPIVVFDVNESLLDLDAIRPAFERIFDDPAVMPPHPEVPAALRRLNDRGFRLFTLTDNTLDISGRQLDRAGLTHLSERRFSVDETARRHKPAPEAYRSVSSALDVDPADICLVACHVWNTIGATAAGWQTAPILRESNAPLDVGPQPDLIGQPSMRSPTS